MIVAMSGGVDSSVAAAMLHEAGASVIGVTFHLWDAVGESKIGRCCAPEDREDARRTCDHLGVPHYVFDEREAFRQTVVDPFSRAYLDGETPAPCVACNQTVKLRRLVDVADSFGAAFVATGHYARITRDPSVSLLRGGDRAKDQTYFLYGTEQSILERLVFPIGHLEKRAVRDEGRRLGVPNADKPDSQELCFVPDGNVGGFIEREGNTARAGRIIDETGSECGTHGGVHNFTVGQRKGLGNLKSREGATKPKYVLNVIPETAEVIVGDEAGLFSSELRARDARWIGNRRGESFDAHVRIRYRHVGAPAKVLPDIDGSGFRVLFAEPQRAITRGQAAVIYRDDVVVGGGIIAA